MSEKVVVVELAQIYSFWPDPKRPITKSYYLKVDLSKEQKERLTNKKVRITIEEMGDGEVEDE